MPALSNSTPTSVPLYFIFLPTLRSDANKRRFFTGNPRFSKVSIISTPTAPVAPTTATLYCLLMTPNLTSEIYFSPKKLYRGGYQIADFLGAVAHFAGGEGFQLLADGFDDGGFDGGGGFGFAEDIE